MNLVRTENMNLPFQKYALDQAGRILSGDRTTNAKCFASKEDIPNITEFAEHLVSLGLFVRVGKIEKLQSYEEEIYCFEISKKPICGLWNPYFTLNIKEELSL